MYILERGRERAIREKLRTAHRVVLRSASIETSFDSLVLRRETVRKSSSVDQIRIAILIGPGLVTSEDSRLICRSATAEGRSRSIVSGSLIESLSVG